MSKLKKLLCFLNLRFLDSSEEQEYVTTKKPLLKEFFTYLYVALTGLLIPYTIRYFQRDIFPQSYIIVGLIALASIIFCIKRNLDNYLEHLLLGYFVVLIGLFTTVFRDLLPGVDPKEAFYMGYAFATIHRLVGYQVLKFRYMLILYVFSIVIKFPLIPNPDVLLNFIVIILDILTLFLCFKSERMERSLFDSLYKSKKDILKFKHLLTSYLPNQMVIFSNDYSQAHYMNNSFKRAFKCHNTVQVKESLARYVIEKDTLDKHKNFFLRIGFLNQDEHSSFSLSNFMYYLGQNVDALRENGMISFPVIEDEKAPVEDQKEVFNDQRVEVQTEAQLLLKNQAKVNSKAVKESPEPTKRNLLPLPEPSDSFRSSDRGSSKSHSSDFILEEGMKRVYKVKIFPLMWDDKEAIAMVFDDITQQKIIMELKVADQNKDLVIAMVSHELRTPLNGMLGLLDIARKHIDKTDALSYLNACRNSGVLMLNLVNSILDMNQIKNKKLRLVYTKLTIKDVLNEIRSLFDYFCLLKNLYLNIEIDPKVPKTIISDKNRLSQILVNLLGNAFKFTFNGGITVKARLEDTDPIRIRFSVEDTGIGIKKQDQDRLFRMYGRLEQEDNKVNTHGIGLGLTISNTLAMLLNPKDQKPIQVESEIGKGTCFSFIVQSQSSDKESAELSLADISSNILNEDRDATVLKKMSVYTKIENLTTSNPNVAYKQQPTTLNSDQRPLINSLEKSSNSIMPLNFEDSSLSRIFRLNTVAKEKKESSNPQKSSGFPEIPEENPQEAEKPWCLVVDDNPFNLMVACHIMEEREYQVKTGLNGQEAIQRVKEHQAKGYAFKVILMDCQMPIMDGYEATKVLREMMRNGECEECPIIALTANNRDEEHDKLCEKVGMSGHVSKPLQIDELEEVLKEVHNMKK